MLQSIHRLAGSLIRRGSIEGIICPMTKWFSFRPFSHLLVLIGWVALLSACRSTPPVATGLPTTLPASAATDLPATSSPTPLEPSPTPVPAIAQVNGESISIAAYQAELARYTAALERPITPEDETRVLDELVNQVLLAQSAAAEGFTATPELVDEKIAALATGLGSQQALSDWMAGNGYLESDFRADLQRAIAAAWMRDQITTGVPLQAEQVHARQILITSSDEAGQVLAQLQNGADFATLAAEYDPIATGDLGWFPRGYLLDPKLDEALFTLQPGSFTPIIQTVAGYHILQLIESDPQRTLDPSARLVLQKLTLQNWLDEKRSQSNIQILKP